MASLRESSDLARKAANVSLGHETVVEAYGEATEDSEGKDAIRIVLVIPPQRAGELTGDQFLEVIGRIRRELSDAGETRTPIIQYATTDDLAVAHDDRTRAWAPSGQESCTRRPSSAA
ncbi:hypothetical protein [Methylobacterium trifolii]|uniref:Uncharacterized protein n=1 Tax=Methylobacterium trifolii TaxID=1003092 RepID=A0ABQ4U001_9HYPH|nr:hypothetical protein [Methylobacterium trifolii]GJE60805.1 hypothetical protein MPOCJGCO_2922 [Methylobacterium trifolii]